MILFHINTIYGIAVVLRIAEKKNREAKPNGRLEMSAVFISVLDAHKNIGLIVSALQKSNYHPHLYIVKYYTTCH